MSKSAYGKLIKEMGAKKYMELRRTIINAMQKPPLTKQQLLCAYCLNEKTFKKALEDLTLMPIVVNINVLLKVMWQNGWTVERLYDAYLKDRGRRIESIICVPCKAYLS